MRFVRVEAKGFLIWGCSLAKRLCSFYSVLFDVLKYSIRSETKYLSRFLARWLQEAREEHLTRLESSIFNNYDKMRRYYRVSYSKRDFHSYMWE